MLEFNLFKKKMDEIIFKKIIFFFITIIFY